MEYKHHIFLSYSRRNTPAMHRIRDSLQRHGLSVWTDENLQAGTPSWKNMIEGAILQSACIVVILSPAAKSSEWIERELDYGIALGKRVFPILVDGEAITAIPFELINVQYIDTRPDFALAMERISRAISSYLEIVPEASDSRPARKTQEIEVSEDVDAAPKRDWDKFTQQTMRMIVWYFFAPAKLARFKRLGGQEAVAHLHAWLLSSFVATLLAIPSLFAFPAYYSGFPDWQMYLSFLIFPLVAFLMATLSVSARSFWRFIGIMVLRWLVLILSALGAVIYFWGLLWLFPNT